MTEIKVNPKIITKEELRAVTQSDQIYGALAQIAINRGLWVVEG